MNEEDKETAYDTLIEASALIYVLGAALDNNEQPVNDTKPYACLVKLIQYKLADALELIQP